MLTSDLCTNLDYAQSCAVHGRLRSKTGLDMTNCLSPECFGPLTLTQLSSTWTER
jgi:hypothetical protein